MERTVVVAGGGPAGFFGALRCKELAPRARVLLLEKGRDVLAKVAISGGGRCNVTHACFEPRELASAYPRGGRELVGPLTRFGPTETVRWFSDRVVPLKTEPDGRMFPNTDSARSVVECLLGEARRLGVEIRTRCELIEARAEPDKRRPRFALRLSGGECLACDRLLIAIGGHRRAGGYELAARLGHTIREPVPSLFTFRIDDPRLRGLSGVTVAVAETHVAGTTLRHTGPLLVTHWGLSGPAVLMLSAWGARALHEMGYRFDLHVNWAPGLSVNNVEMALKAAADERGRQHLHAHQPDLGSRAGPLPRRLWEVITTHAGIAVDVTYATMNRSHRRLLAEAIVQTRFTVSGQSPFKDEFVTCGGVTLDEIDMRTMQSRIAPGLHLAGEVLDIDGITGGYNFQAAWTTGWLAGEGMSG